MRAFVAGSLVIAGLTTAFVFLSGSADPIWGSGTGMARGAHTGERPKEGGGHEPGDYQVGAFNLAGANADYYDPENVASTLIAALQERLPAVVAVQEACDTVLAEVENALDNYTAVLSQVAKPADPAAPAGTPDPEFVGGECEFDGARLGNALIVRDDMGFDTDHPRIHDDLTPQGNHERRQMVCLTSHQRRLAACTVHLTHGRGADRENLRVPEIATARRILAEEYRDYRIILGGDLNDLPGSQMADHVYHQAYGGAAHGWLKEATSPCGDVMGAECRGGETTHTLGKIDYIFVSPDITVRHAEVVPTPYSDHAMLWAGITIASTQA